MYKSKWKIKPTLSIFVWYGCSTNKVLCACINQKDVLIFARLCKLQSNNTTHCVWKAMLLDTKVKILFMQISNEPPEA